MKFETKAIWVGQEADDLQEDLKQALDSLDS